MPKGTLYSEYSYMNIGELLIKGITIDPKPEEGYSGDWYCQRLTEIGDTNTMQEELEKADQDTNYDIRLRLYLESRDAAFDYDQKYAVYDYVDLSDLIERLEQTKTDLVASAFRLAQSNK